MKRPKPPRAAIVGAGRLARALLPALRAAGYPLVAVAATTLRRARSAVRGQPGALATIDPSEAARRATLVLLAVPDREIETVARRLAADGQPWRGRTVVHHAGALGLEPLRPLAKLGARVGLIHPFQTLGPTATAAEVLGGSRARVEGGAPIRRLARELGLRPFRLDGPLSPARRSAYHAAASLLSNDLVALIDGALALLETAGLDRAAALEALGSLGAGTLLQTTRHGLSGSLTGPVVRGDRMTVEAHLTRLRRLSPAMGEVHRLLSLRLLDLARREGLSRPPGMKRLLLDAAKPGGRSTATTV